MESMDRHAESTDPTAACRGEIYNVQYCSETLKVYVHVLGSWHLPVQASHRKLAYVTSCCVI